MLELNSLLLFSECLFCLIAALSILLNKSMDSYKRWLTTMMFMCGGVMFMMDLHSWDFEGHHGRMEMVTEWFSTFMSFFLPNVMAALFHTYAYHCLFGNYRKDKTIQIPIVRYYLFFGSCTLSCLTIILTQFFGFVYYFNSYGTYMRGNWYILPFIFGFLFIIIDGSVIFQYRKNASVPISHSLFSYILVPPIGIFLQPITNGWSWTNIATGVALVIIYIGFQMEQNRLAIRKSEEIYEAKIDLMLSQVGPHFIYNTLTTIKHLCKTNPESAVETIDEFAAYLRTNLDTLTIRQKIPFSQELQHVKNYISIEKRRFGNRIQVEYYIEESDFLVPALVLQPIVENAIKHGITKKPQGGIIKIRTFRDEKGFVAKVEDDGVGFDSKSYWEKGGLPSETVKLGNQEITRRHLGIENVKKRVEAMSRGSMTIDSVPGEGTQVVIRIPYEEG